MKVPTLFRSTAIWLLAFTLCCVSLASELLASEVTVSGPIDIGDASDAGPFQSTVVPGSANARLAELNHYREDEYLFGGTANIFGYDSAASLTLLEADIPYTTRLLIVRPSNADNFSGRVYLLPSHPARGAVFWEAIRDYVLREGDIFVSVFIGTDQRSRSASADSEEPADALSALKAWSPKRYNAITWPQDDGISWDVFGQAARLLRSDNPANPLQGLSVKRMFAVGWSFTGSFLRVYINEGFHDRYRQPSGAPLLDGYLIGISNGHFRSGYLALNARSEPPPVDDIRRLPKPIDVPVIELMTQNEAVTRGEELTEQRDQPPGQYRLYEVPGLTHGDGLQDPINSEVCAYPASDVPLRHIFWASLHNLDRWVTDGIAPPLAVPMQIDTTLDQAIIDSWGNALGGVRPAQISVPLAYYGDPGDQSCDSLGKYYMMMRRIPLTPDQLAQLYPNGAADYLQQFEAQLDELIRLGWILPADRETELSSARQAAKVAFKSSASGQQP